MAEHRWSGWPGAWCLDCGCSDPREDALANATQETIERTLVSGEYSDTIDPKLMECAEPGSNRYNPYTREDWTK